MRVAVITRTGLRVGGAEAYVERVVRLLHDAGHDVALFLERAAPDDDPRRVELPEGVTRYALGDPAAARTRISGWRPDVVFQQGLDDPAAERALLEVAPVVAFLHDYHGMCVSGSRTLGWPTPTPCHRRFGPACLLVHHLRRCGGRDPRTTWSLRATQARRLEALRACARVLVFSEHMRREAVRHGVSPARVTKVPCLAPTWRPAEDVRRARGEDVVRLTFVGRMEPLKGGDLLLAALPAVARRLGRRVTLTLAGDGSARAAWAARAASLGDARARAELVGWLAPEQVSELFARSDLLVLPSVWPEPFGLVGIEAGLHGVPAAAFRVGGIEEWLTEGANGALAPGNPPTTEGLVDAIVRCLESADVHEDLRDGARRVASSFTPERHLTALEAAFRAAGGEGRTPCAEAVP